MHVVVSNRWHVSSDSSTDAKSLRRERYLHEIESVACLSEHPNVVKYYRGWQQEGHFFIQMELCEGGNLKDLTTSQTTPLEEDRIWDWVRQVRSSELHFAQRKATQHRVPLRTGPAWGAIAPVWSK